MMATRKSKNGWIIIAVIAVLYFVIGRKKEEEVMTNPDLEHPDLTPVPGKKDEHVHTSPVKHSDVTSSHGNIGVMANNPFNLRQTRKSQRWQGEIGTIYAGDKDKHGFVRFDTPEDGARACLKNMMHVLKHHKTIKDYIKVESPASDGNRPGPYAERVAQAVGIHPDVKLDVNNLDEISKFAVAINSVEWGVTPLSQELFKNEYVKLNPMAKDFKG